MLTQALLEVRHPALLQRHLQETNVRITLKLPYHFFYKSLVLPCTQLVDHPSNDHMRRTFVDIFAIMRQLLNLPMLDKVFHKLV